MKCRHQIRFRMLSIFFPQNSKIILAKRKTSEHPTAGPPFSDMNCRPAFSIAAPMKIGCLLELKPPGIVWDKYCFQASQISSHWNVARLSKKWKYSQTSKHGLLWAMFQLGRVWQNDLSSVVFKAQASVSITNQTSSLSHNSNGGLGLSSLLIKCRTANW